MVYAADAALTKHKPREDNLLLCCQWKNGTAKLLYKLKLDKDVPANDGQAAVSHTLRQVLRCTTFVFHGHASAYATRDLAARRDYIGYEFIGFNCVLHVTAFAQPDPGSYGPVIRDSYAPPCKGSVEKGLEEFRMRYGRPPSSTEIPRVRKQEIRERP